ncbi:hypothetical protein [Yersinia ruckeri]|uniref:hypothetical protein n=1 Tax=Yersinia ruckeri TaxID=29486 RepID=UPI0022381C05|nr:hypothetical protein [Yersinia ruckeri]MCW6598788.1 hypothetical protein [Yersinia ruckeri]
MNSKDGFFISKETFSGLSNEAQNEILAALGLDVLQDNDDLMILSKRDVLAVIELCQSRINTQERPEFYAQLIRLISYIGKRKKHITNIKALSASSKISSDNLLKYLEEINYLTKTLTGRRFAELSEQNTVVYIAKDTLKAIKLAVRKPILQRFVVRKK